MSPVRGKPPQAAAAPLARASNGVSLIEAVIYVALVAVFSVALVSVIIGTVTAFNRSRVKRGLTANATLALERMVREARLASGVDAAGSTFDAHPGAITLQTIISPSDQTATTRRFFLSAGTLMLVEGGGAPVALTSGVTVSNLVFRSTSTPVSRAIRIELTIEGGAGKLRVQEMLSATAVLRGSY